jgi:hypothetical protein
MSDVPYGYVLFAVYAVVMFPAVGYANSLIDGWFSLGRRYRDRATRAAAAEVKGQTIRLGSLTEVWSAATIGVGDDGLRLRVSGTYRMGHPPLLVPWPDVHPLGIVKPWFRAWETYRLGDRHTVGFDRNSHGARIVRAALERWLIEVRHP